MKYIKNFKLGELVLETFTFEELLLVPQLVSNNIYIFYLVKARECVMKVLVLNGVYLT